MSALHVSQPLVCSQSHSSYAYVSRSGTTVKIKKRAADVNSGVTLSVVRRLLDGVLLHGV